MPVQAAPASILGSVRVVLYEPQDPVNIAATIRAMKNMGCRDLYVVRSVPYDPWRLEGIAHDTSDVIERIRPCDTIEEALEGVVRVAGFTARRRARMLRPRQLKSMSSCLPIPSADCTPSIFSRRATMSTSCVPSAHSSIEPLPTHVSWRCCAQSSSRSCGQSTASPAERPKV